MLSVDQIKGELYNLETDPHEWENVYHDNKNSVICEQLKTELLEHLTCSFAGFPIGKG